MQSMIKESIMDKKTVFISYSQKDKDRVSLFASLMAQNGFDIWMDVKNIPLGESIVSVIANGLNNIDIYMVFISHNSNKSPWVTEELNIALTKSIEQQKPRIIPVLLDDCAIPTVLSGRLYLDARKSIQTAFNQLNEEFRKEHLGNNLITSTSNAPILTSAVFGLSKETDISIGPFCEGFTKEDLVNDREKIKRLLRKRANGILMNFVPLSDFDLQSPIPKYKNGVYDESIEQTSGGTNSSICEKIMATTTVFNPDSRKIDELVKNQLEKLGVNSLAYVFSLPLQVEALDKKCMQRIQDNYSIISYDFEDGATIEYEDDFFLSIKCTLEQIQIKMQAEYDFTFSRKAIKFSPIDFINWLTKGL